MHDNVFLIYLVNVVVSLSLAALMTFHWRTHEGGDAATRTWMMASWVMVLANAVFMFQPWLPPAFGRVTATWTVTLAFISVWFGARSTAGLAPPWRLAAGCAAAHLGLLIFFQYSEFSRPWRGVSNGLFWAGLSAMAAHTFREAPSFYGRGVLSPRLVSTLHALHHLVRILLGLIFHFAAWPAATSVLHTASDAVVGSFNVALFVSLLVADLRDRHHQLMEARAEVDKLTGLLPICAWCKKIRDDRGYWQQVEEYISARSEVQFTHGICQECVRKVIPDLPT